MFLGKITKTLFYRIDHFPVQSLSLSSFRVNLTPRHKVWGDSIESKVHSGLFKPLTSENAQFGFGIVLNLDVSDVVLTTRKKITVIISKNTSNHH